MIGVLMSLGLLVLAYLWGGAVERNHLDDLVRRETPVQMPSDPSSPGNQARENFTTTLGGHLLPGHLAQGDEVGNVGWGRRPRRLHDQRGEPVT